MRDSWHVDDKGVGRAVSFDRKGAKVTEEIPEQKAGGVEQKDIKERTKSVLNESRYIKNPFLRRYVQTGARLARGSKGSCGTRAARNDGLGRPHVFGCENWDVTRRETWS